MKNLSLHLFLIALLTTAALPAADGSQSTTSGRTSTVDQANAAASDQADHSSFRVADGSVFHVVLAKNVDAKKNNVGDEVTTTIVEDLKSNGQVIIPKNSRVIGRITQIQAHRKDHPESEIAIAFDRLVIKDRPEIPLSASIQAVAPPETALSADSEKSGMGGTSAGSAGQGGSPTGSGA